VNMCIIFINTDKLFKEKETNKSTFFKKILFHE